MEKLIVNTDTKWVRTGNSRWIRIIGFILTSVLSLNAARGEALDGNIKASDQQPKIKKPVSANLHVDRGLMLSEHPAMHLVHLDKKDIEDLLPLNKLPKVAKLRLAIQEFRSALQNRDALEGYSSAEVYAYLGWTYQLLGTEIQRYYEQGYARYNKLLVQSQRHFQESFRYYRLALKSTPINLQYNFAVGLVESIIASGNLVLALTEINNFERKKLTPSSYSDHTLLRLKAEIYWTMKRFEDAGVIYEEWFRRGIGNVSISKGSILHEKLRYLKNTTGHPSNIPLETDPK